MIPVRGTSDETIDEFRTRLPEEYRNLSNKELRAIINSFTGFIKHKVKEMDTPFFRIKNFGDYRLSPRQLCYHLKKVRNIVAKINKRNEPGGRGSTVSEKKMNYYYNREEKIVKALSIFSRIYGRSYLESKFPLFKELEIPEYEASKEELIYNTHNYLDFTEQEFIWYTDEELKEILES